jgi:hypothetical protein
MVMVCLMMQLGISDACRSSFLYRNLEIQDNIIHGSSTGLSWLLQHIPVRRGLAGIAFLFVDE